MCDHICSSGKNYLYCKQCRSNKQEGEFQRLGDTCCHTCKCRGKKKTAGSFFLLRFCTLIHSQSCSRETKDHKDKLTREIPGCICAEMCNICRISKLCKENILSALNHLSGNFHRTAYGCLPERHVEYVMQTKRDQSSLNKSEDQGSYISGTCYQSAQCVNSVLDNRPYKVKKNSHKHIYNCGNDRYKSRASEE